MVTVEELLEKEKEYKEEIALLKAQYKKINDRVDTKLKTPVLPQVVDALPDDELREIKEDIADGKKRVAALENNVTGWVRDMSKTILTLSEMVEQGRQYSRFNGLLIHGFKNCPLNLNDIDFIFYIAQELNCMFPSLKGKILPIHIDEAHPLSKKKGGTKLVLIKFVNRWVKRSILSCEADLRGTGISLSEHLTDFTLKLISSAKALVGDENVWVFKNTVFAQSGGKELKIRNSDDLKKLRTESTNLTSQNNTTISNTTEMPQPPPTIVSTIDLTNNETTAPAASTFPNNLPLGRAHGSQVCTLPHQTHAPSRGTYRARGRPSHNGRGGSRNYNFYYPHHRNTYNPHWKNSMKF